MKINLLIHVVVLLAVYYRFIDADRHICIDEIKLQCNLRHYVTYNKLIKTQPKHDQLNSVLDLNIRYFNDVTHSSVEKNGPLHSGKK